MNRHSTLLAAVLFLVLQPSYSQFHPQAPLDEEEAMIKAETQRYVSLANAYSSTTADNNIDVTYYKLDIAVTTSPNYLRGVVTLQATSRVNNLAEVTLDLMSAMTVDSVKMDTTRVTFVQHPTTVVITLDRSYGNGEMVVLDVYYRGVPGSSGFGSFAFSSHSSTPWVWSLSEPYGAKDWWPCKDHPLDKADSVDIWVTCNSAFKVGSNGKLVAVLDNGNGTKTYQWAERYPISTYLVSIAITNFAEFSNWFKYTPTDSMEVLNYVLPENLANAQANLPRAIDMLHIFSDKYGLYPFINEKYGHSQFGWGGGMEHQTMTSLGGFSENLVAHELAHMWFGDMITCANWPNIWMNEGFATYSVALYQEAKYGTNAYWSYMNSQMSSARNAVGTIYVQDTSNVGTLFNSALVYAKGASVLHMVRHVMGDSLFFHAIKSYADDPRFKYNVAVTEDFQEVCETVSGMQLDYFFDQWIYGEKYPRYTYWWTSSPDTNGYRITVSISQTTGTTNPSFFKMPVDFKLTATGWDTTVVLIDTTNPQLFTFTVPRLPTTGQLDPQSWILRTVTQVPVAVAEGPSTASSFALHQNYPNPFNPRTAIGFTLHDEGQATLVIYDVLGREVSTLLNEYVTAGMYEVSWDATNEPSGVYFYKLRQGSSVAVRKLLLLR